MGEAARYETLAARTALAAILGEPEKRPATEQLARDHALRAATYKEAARLMDQPATHDQQPTTR